MKKYLLVATALFVITACGQNETVSIEDVQMEQEKSQGSQENLLHHNYVLVAIDDAPFETEDNAMAPNIEFGEGLHISGRMCNNFFGQGELIGNVLKASGVGMTRKFCVDSILNELDTKIGQLLEEGAAISLEDNGKYLLLTGKDGALTFELRDYK